MCDRDPERGTMSFLSYPPTLPFCFLATSSPPKQGEDGDRAIGDGTGTASAAPSDVAPMTLRCAAAAAAAAAAFFEAEVETKTDFPLRGATTAADLESPAVRRLRRSAAVAAAAADDDDAACDAALVDGLLLNAELMARRIQPENKKCAIVSVSRTALVFIQLCLQPANTQSLKYTLSL